MFVVIDRWSLFNGYYYIFCDWVLRRVNLDKKYICSCKLFFGIKYLMFSNVCVVNGYLVISYYVFGNVM